MRAGAAPAWALLTVIAAAAALGWRTALLLRTAGYRIPGDQGADVPPRGPWWWPAPVLAALAGFATWHLAGLAGGAALPAFLLFAWLTVALAWIDLDVQRIPTGLVAPATAAVALLLVPASAAAGGSRALTALAGAVVLWLLYLALALVAGLGGGDLRLAPMVGMLLGWLGPNALLAGTAATFLLGGVGAVALLLTGRATPRTHIAFAPAICLGVFAALGWTL